MGCRIVSGFVALVQGLAVVVGVVSILILADAMFNDSKFSTYIEKAKNVTYGNKTFDLQSVEWIQKEKEYNRGLLDWFLMIALILTTTTHTSLVLLIILEISNRRKLKRAAEHRKWRTNAVPTPTQQQQQQSSVQRSHLRKKSMEEQALKFRLNSKTADQLLMNDSDSNMNQNITVNANPDLDQNDMNKSGQDSPKAGVSFQPRLSGEKRTDLDTLDSIGVQPEPEPEIHKINIIKSEEEKQELYQRKTFICAAFSVGICTIILTCGIILEFHLIKQLDLFYSDPKFYTDKSANNSLTSPFPSICAFGRKSELRKIDFPMGTTNFSAFPPRGVCNNFELKLGASATSVLLAIFSITLTFLYWLCDKKLRRQNKNNNPSAKGNQVYDTNNARQSLDSAGETGENSKRAKEKSHHSKISGNNNLYPDQPVR